jgi:hypothetical protein
VLRLGAILLLGACGRLGFGDPRTGTDAPGQMDASSHDAAADAAPPPRLIQTDTNQSGAVSSASRSFGAPVMAGDTIVVAIDHDYTLDGTLSVTDSRGNTYTEVGGCGSQQLFEDIFFAIASSSGTTNITVSRSNPSKSYFEIRLHEFAGLGAYDTWACTSGVSGGTDTAATPLATLHFDDELIFGFGSFLGAGAGAVGSGFSLCNNAYGDITEMEIVPTAGMYRATATPTINEPWVMMMATFRGG